VKRLPFQQVDVFTAVPFKGNPVAVVFDGNDLKTQQMQSIANWTNLSETVFVLAPTDGDADYRLRIFTPRAELPFAGHPTLGSAHAVLRSGHNPKRPGVLIQECAKGLIEVRLAGRRLSFRLPQPLFTTLEERQLATAAAALRISRAQIERGSIVDVGPVWLTLQLRDAEAVTNLNPDMAAIAALSIGHSTGVTVFGLHGIAGPPDIEVRSFAPADGIPEDPVCGSGNGCVAAMIARDHVLNRNSYVAGQGGCLDRDGRVEVQFEDNAIWVGGEAVTCVEGTLLIET